MGGCEEPFLSFFAQSLLLKSLSRETRYIRACEDVITSKSIDYPNSGFEIQAIVCQSSRRPSF